MPSLLFFFPLESEEADEVGGSGADEMVDRPEGVAEGGSEEVDAAEAKVGGVMEAVEANGGNSASAAAQSVSFISDDS